MTAGHTPDQGAPIIAIDGRLPEEADLDGRCSERAASQIRHLESQVAHLQVALLSQRQIGTVIGLVAQRFGCTTAQAWTFLVRLSQNTNVKLRVVARVLLEAYDGSSPEEDAQLLTQLAAHLPPSGWPGVHRAADDSSAR